MTKAMICMLLVAFLGGCAAVGPTSKQGALGQDASNSTLNKATYTQQPTGAAGEMVNTFTADTLGATRETLIDADGVEARGTAEIRTDLALVLADGTRVTTISGKDVYLDELTGERDPKGKMKLSVKGLRTSASDPTRALNEAYDRLAPLIAELAKQQKESIDNQTTVLGDLVAKAIEAAVKAATMRPVP